MTCQCSIGFLISRKSCPSPPSTLNIADYQRWAFWKRAHKGDAGLSNIQKFHVHDAVNEDTLRLVNVALKTYQVPEGDSRHTRLPKWPGLIFNIETEEGKVMLGSPNGIAAGYFRKFWTSNVSLFDS